jgi:4-amino-4-deoxy-L-arabinose transferase-like glycosyltransferase
MSFKSNNYQENKFILVSLLAIIFFFFISLFIERNIYNNHVNLIFIQASDFLNGKVLYKEIYVKYGVLGVLINATSLFIFGENIFSIFLIHNFFYFSSIFIILLIINKIDYTYKSSITVGEGSIGKLCLILFIIIIHPSIPFAPWPNYLAFFPLTLSLLFLLTPKRINYFYSGFFLSLACLIRETIFLSAIIIFVGIFFYLLFNSINSRS